LGGDHEDFIKVMAVWGLRELGHQDQEATLKDIERNASQEETGFGGNIMDPCVCTHFPNVKRALRDLLAME
jgi:hypothetical protein